MGVADPLKCWYILYLQITWLGWIHDISVSILKRLVVVWHRTNGSLPNKTRGFSLLQSFQNSSLSHTDSYSVRYRVLSLVAKRPESEDENFKLSSAESKNELRYDMI